MDKRSAIHLLASLWWMARCLSTLVAIATVHWPAEWQTLSELWKGYAVIDNGYGNFKLPLGYLFMLSSLVLSGSGRLGVDTWLKNLAHSNQGYCR